MEIKSPPMLTRLTRLTREAAHGCVKRGTNFLDFFWGDARKKRHVFPFFVISFHKSSRPSDVDCRPGNSFHFGNVAITRREFPCSVHWREIYQQRNGFWQPVAREFQSKWAALSVISLYWLLISDSVSFQVERKWHNGWLQVNVLTKR